MAKNPDDLMLRAKTIGALMREARQARNLSLQECAQAISATAEQLEAYETGEQMISLPELEALAYSLDTPLDHFWQPETRVAPDHHQPLVQVEQLLRLRHRMIGVLLRQARQEMGLSLEDLAEKAQIDVERLQAYELGQEAAPLPELEELCAILQRSIREFQDKHGPVGEWNQRQRALKNFLELPLDIQVFVSNPSHRPYLDLAKRLSDMSVERLRAVAEGLLEITY
jgi:transcriptional regulator with XRE-family HTH domain